MSQKASPFPRPQFRGWKIASFSSAQQLFQIFGSVVTLFLIGAVGSHFPPTYAALMTSVFSTIGSAVFLICNLFGINETEPGEWVFWESIYIFAFTFLFTLNTITMFYSSIRWGHVAWWFATIICTLVSISFLMSLVHILRKQKKILNGITESSDRRAASSRT